MNFGLPKQTKLVKTKEFLAQTLRTVPVTGAFP
jgi:hypothetical protein